MHSSLPAGAIFVGMLSGTVSVWGFAHLSELLERTIGLGDTCGVHNLPGVLGGLVSSPIYRMVKSYRKPYTLIVALIMTLVANFISPKAE